MGVDMDLPAVTVVYGPPGTGKTTTLLQILSDYVAGGVDRGRIAYVSFTKAAAQEALSRMKLTTSKKVCTLHALAYRLLYVSKGQVVDIDKLQEFADKVGLEISGATPDSERELTLGDELYSLQQLSVARMENIEQTYAASHRPGTIGLFRYFHETYLSWKTANGFIDFNDMLVQATARDLKLEADILFIDEAQDLSRLQWQFIRKLAQQVKEVYIGGDDDQAIYEWSGAEPHGMAEFEHDFSARRIVLSQSWRLPENVHRLANQVVSRIRTRVPKEFLPRPSVGKVTQHGFPQSITFDSRDTLVLYRNHANRKELETELLKQSIPYLSMVGRPSPLQSKWATAVRTWHSLRNKEGGVSPQAIGQLRSALRPGYAQMSLEKIRDTDWSVMIDASWSVTEYLSKLIKQGVENLQGTSARTKIGSIHSAKGREASRVVLYTAMSKRTVESMLANPDAEARVWYVGVTRAKDELDIIEGPSGYDIFS